MWRWDIKHIPYEKRGRSSSCLYFHTEHSLSCVSVPRWRDNGAGHVTRDTRDSSDNTNYSPSITINYRRLKTSGRHILMSLYIINWSLHCLVMKLSLLSCPGYSWSIVAAKRITITTIKVPDSWLGRPELIRSSKINNPTYYDGQMGTNISFTQSFF